MGTIRKILDLSELVLAAFCVAAFVAMFVLGIATVVFRYVIESSLAFPDELIRYLFIWMIFLGSAIAFRRNMHAAIGVLVTNLPETLKRPALMIATAASGLFFIVLLTGGVELAARVRAQISPALEVSMAWVYSAIPVGMVFLLVYTVELLARQWAAEPDALLADDH